TSTILDQCAIDGKRRDSLERQKRECKTSVTHPILGTVILRDQKPLIVSKLKPRLTDCSIEEWFQMLNNRVFFWPTQERLVTFMSAREYTGKRHLVLTVDTLRLVQDYQDKITLTPMNTGNTQPIAHKRGVETFSRMKDYPFQERLKRGPYYTVVEVAV